MPQISLIVRTERFYFAPWSIPLFVLIPIHLCHLRNLWTMVEEGLVLAWSISSDAVPHARTIAEEFLNGGVGLPDHSAEDITGVYDLREIRGPQSTVFPLIFGIPG